MVATASQPCRLELPVAMTAAIRWSSRPNQVCPQRSQREQTNQRGLQNTKCTSLSPSFSASAGSMIGITSEHAPTVLLAVSCNLGLILCITCLQALHTQVDCPVTMTVAVASSCLSNSPISICLRRQCTHPEVSRRYLPEKGFAGDDVGCPGNLTADLQCPIQQRRQPRIYTHPLNADRKSVV